MKNLKLCELNMNLEVCIKNRLEARLGARLENRLEARIKACLENRLEAHRHYHIT